MVQLEKPYQLTVKDIIAKLETDVERGLTSEAARRRLKEYGENILDVQKQKSWIFLFLQQFWSPLVGVLAFAAAMAFSFQEWLEGGAILAVILINALIGFFMEWQALRSMEALRQLAQNMARVYRDGELVQVKASVLVPGDIVYLEAGDVVPADCRIFDQRNLGVKEAALTGESTPVKKQVEALGGEIPVPDRSNQLFKGTTILRGNAKAVVVATGKATQLGHIAHLVQTASKEATPLEVKLAKLSQRLIGLTLALALLILSIGLLQGRDLYLMIKTSIALAVAAIPEGLPIVATIALARGMLRLARHNVIVKKLSAAETLGETQVIFTDKTGTLTENRLSVDTILFEAGQVDLSFKDKAITLRAEAGRELLDTFAFDQICLVGALCNNAAMNSQTTENGIGDPLEVALLTLARAKGLDIAKLRDDYPRIKEIPFDSESKMMGTLNRNGKRPDFLVCIKGALEVVLEESDYYLTENGRQAFSDVHKTQWHERADQLASKGLRILAFAYSEIDEPEEDFFHSLIFIGVIGFLDPPRQEVPQAVQTCKNAGINVIMVTGDHPETARNIAFRTRLIGQEDALFIHGKDIGQSGDKKEGQKKELLKTHVFARVSPAQKLDLVQLYQAAGYIVAMTGDGINDTPALKKADIGIAMGKRGTEAAREVADLVLEDDSFTSIVMAVRQGRGIFENIRHFVVYLMSCNLSELLVVAAAFLANFSLPLLPLQILFLNMVTDVFPALALGMNREAEDVMEQPPRKSGEAIILRRSWWAIGIYALGITLACFSALLYSVYHLQASAEVANNMTFYTLILAQLWHVFNLPRNFFHNEVIRNPYVWLALLICVLITTGVYLIPTTREVLHLQALPLNLFGMIFLFSLIPLVFVQTLKALKLIKA